MPALYHSLLAQNFLYTSLMVGVVVAVPILFAVTAMIRTLTLAYRTNPVWTRHLWTLEQILKPWVMGDVAAISICSLFLSIQEPSDDFVFLVVRLVLPPIGVFACLGQGVACWGLRWSAPPLRPIPRSIGLSDSEDSETPAHRGPGVPKVVRVGCVVGKLVWKEVFTWLLWGALIYVFGPHEPQSVHNLKELNSVLGDEVSRLQLELVNRLPEGLGSCAELRLRRTLERTGDPEAAGCKELVVPPFDIPGIGLTGKLHFVDGLRTIVLASAQVFPETRGVNELYNPMMTVNGEQRWAFGVKGYFTGLRVWMEATKGTQQLIDNYICCDNPYHWSIQVSVLCVDGIGFTGTANVDNFHIDDVKISDDSRHESRTGEEEESLFEVDLGDTPGLITEAIRTQLQNLLVSKTAGTGPPAAGMPPLVLTDLLNQLIENNGGVKCPEFTM